MRLHKRPAFRLTGRHFAAGLDPLSSAARVAASIPTALRPSRSSCADGATALIVLPAPVSVHRAKLHRQLEEKNSALTDGEFPCVVAGLGLSGNAYDRQHYRRSADFLTG